MDGGGGGGGAYHSSHSTHPPIPPLLVAVELGFLAMSGLAAAAVLGASSRRGRASAHGGGGGGGGVEGSGAAGAAAVGEGGKGGGGNELRTPRAPIGSGSGNGGSGRDGTSSSGRGGTGTGTGNGTGSSRSNGGGPSSRGARSGRGRSSRRRGGGGGDMMMLLDVYDVGDDATPPPPTSMGGTDDGRAEGQSSGDSTRRAFVGLLLLALLSRAVLLPVQAWFYYPPPPPGGDGGQGGGGRQPQLRHIEPTSGLCVGSALCVLSRTLPCLTFATAFSLLVLYYAQLAGTAGGGGPRGYWAEALTSRSFFRACNSAMYSVYGLAYLAAAYVPGVPYGLFQTVVWSMLCGVYLALLGCLGWFGPVLLRLLRPSLERRTALALRLSATCAVCAAVFLARAVFLGRAVSRATASWEEVKEEDWDGGRDQVGGQGGGTTDQEEATGGSYQDLNDEVWRRLDGTLLVYALLELLPGAAILAMMMHQGRAGRGGGGGVPPPPTRAPATPWSRAVAGLLRPPSTPAPTRTRPCCRSQGRRLPPTEAAEEEAWGCWAGPWRCRSSSREEGEGVQGRP